MKNATGLDNRLAYVIGGNMFRENIKREIANAWIREFRSNLTSVRYQRSATNGIFDPVTETYTGGTNGIDQTVNGMFRKIKSSLVDKLNLTLDDRKFTILQDDLTFTPEENDVLDGEWRVVKYDEDNASVFYNIYVRRV
jgi:hypothetical protein